MMNQTSDFFSENELIHLKWNNKLIQIANRNALVYDTLMLQHIIRVRTDSSSDTDRGPIWVNLD